jgi:steroid delta-isomerase-like uncharacterized protein
LVAVACFKDEEEVPRDGRAIVRRKFEEFIPKWDLRVIDEVFDEDIVSHDPSEPEPLRGREAYRTAAEAFGVAFPKLRIRIDDQICEGDRVATRWTATGRNEGELVGLPATGVEVEFTGIDIHRVSDGRIVEEWSNWDTLGLMRQLGLIPEGVS